MGKKCFFEISSPIEKVKFRDMVKIIEDDREAELLNEIKAERKKYAESRKVLISIINAKLNK